MLSQTIERDIIEGVGHEMGCWEWNVEELIETAAGEGVELEGRHDEIYRHTTLIDHVIDGLASGRSTCHCQVEGSREWGDEEE